MKISFIKQGIWWICNKFENGQLTRYSFIWPMVTQWFDSLFTKEKE